MSIRAALAGSDRAEHSTGACIGTFALFSARTAGAIRLLASMIKVPALFFLTLLVTLPSLYVFNASVGSRLTVGAVVRLLVATLGVIVGGPGFAGAHRRGFLGEHDKLSVHSPVQRGDLRRFGNPRHAVSAPDPAPADAGPAAVENQTLRLNRPRNHCPNLPVPSTGSTTGCSAGRCGRSSASG